MLNKISDLVCGDTNQLENKQLRDIFRSKIPYDIDMYMCSNVWDKVWNRVRGECERYIIRCVKEKVDE